LTSAGFEPARAIMEVDTWEGVKNAVRFGLGAAVVFRSVVQRELMQGEFQTMHVAGFAQSRELCLIASPHRSKERMTTVFRELLAHLEIKVPQVISVRPDLPHDVQ